MQDFDANRLDTWLYSPYKCVRCSFEEGASFPVPVPVTVIVSVPVPVSVPVGCHWEPLGATGYESVSYRPSDSGWKACFFVLAVRYRNILRCRTNDNESVSNMKAKHFHY